MTIDIKDCDLNENYFHFTNRSNIDSILAKGLIPQVGTASQIINDRPNVSISKGGKGIMGIIGGFIEKFGSDMKISDIPEEFRKYFPEITDFTQKKPIGKVLACRAMRRKLNDEVYFRVIPTNEQIERARIGGGLTGYDVNLPEAISRDQISVVTDSEGRVLSALEVAHFIYDKAKDVAVFREMHRDFFRMFESDKEQLQSELSDRITQAKNRVFYGEGLGVGKSDPISLHTTTSFVYRVTGMDQLADIVNCGYVRPKEGRLKGGHKNEVFWSIGGEKTFYYDKRPVIEASTDKVEDGQIGCLSLDDLSAVWVFDYEQNSYVNVIDLMMQIREDIRKSNGSISGEQLLQALARKQAERKLDSRMSGK